MKSLDEFMGDVFKYSLEVTGTHLLRLNHKHANGCGAKGGVKVPKTMWFVDIESACVGHDISWQIATSLDDLKKGNEEFDNNLKKICDAESCCGFMKYIRRMRIAKYVSLVELVGTPAEAKKRGFENV